MVSMTRRASPWECPGATLAKMEMARSRSRRVMACRAACSSKTTSDDSGTSSPLPARTRRREMSSGRERCPAMSLSRTSSRRPPVLYLPTRMPPTRALMVVATSSTDTPTSAHTARSGVTRNSGMPTR